MLGSDRFTFETPNVIDPGDLPPSPPPRRSSTRKGSKGSHGSNHSHTASTHDESSDDYCSSDDNSACNNSIEVNSNKFSSSNRSLQVRVDRSTARLLENIGECDLSPTPPLPYDPYDDDDDDDEEQGASRGGHGHSLPSVEEARLYATRLLVRSDSPPKRDKHKMLSKKLKATIRLDSDKEAFGFSRDYDRSSSDHLVRKRCFHLAWRVVIVMAIMGVVIGVGAAVARALEGSSNSSPFLQTGASSQQERLEDITAFLTNNGISSSADLSSNASPQALAATWMAATDVLQMDVPERLHSNSRFVQRYVLAVLFYALGGNNMSDDNKGGWKEDYNFLSATDECSWYAETVMVGFVEEATAVGVSCSAELQVRNLYMPSNNLKGSLPSELAFLTHLDMLSLPDNQVTGSLPSELVALTNLVYLDVKYNQVSGFLPDWIGDLEQLEVLGLSNNQLAGAVPPSYGTLARLKTLALDDNALTGSMDFANHLTNLEYFWADRNLLTGIVNDDFLSRLGSLRQLDLSFNNLKCDSDTFPVHLFQHQTLRVLDLAEMDFSETKLPELEATNHVLEYLSLRHSNLSGSIPDSFVQLQQLQHLDLFDNALTGLLTNDMGEMKSLTYLFLGKNRFTMGQDFPPFLSQLVNLRELSLESLNLGGVLPTWISYLAQLRLLDVSDNGLAGPVPHQVWELPQLNYLLLNDNSLSGTVPATIPNADKLQIVSLYNNNFTSDGDINHFCDSNPNMDLLAVDCTLTCSDDCCKHGCCKPDDDDCFNGRVLTYLTWFEGMWEFNYTRASYSFDPAILAEDAVAVVLVQEENEDGSGYPGEFDDLP